VVGSATPGENINSVFQSTYFLLDFFIVFLATFFTTDFFTGAGLASTTSAAAAMVMDLFQRIYTDDGQGDGRLTSQGVRALRAFARWNSNSDGHSPIGLPERFPVLTTPIAVAASPSRRTLTQQYANAMTRAEQDLAVPAFRRHRNQADGLNSKANPNSGTLVLYPILPSIVIAMDRVPTTADRLITRRDAARIAIALEQYRRAHRAYPATLQLLVPTLLNAVPPDPADGNPLRYTLVENKPLIYSIGSDAKDDGGAPATDRNSHKPVNNWKAAPWASNEVSGDWILFPEPKAIED
jgi:hypothetical protein